MTGFKPDVTDSALPCCFCGDPEFVDIADIWADGTFQLDACCPDLFDPVIAEMHIIRCGRAICFGVSAPRSLQACGCVASATGRAAYRCWIASSTSVRSPLRRHATSSRAIMGIVRRPAAGGSGPAFRRARFDRRGHGRQRRRARVQRSRHRRGEPAVHPARRRAHAGLELLLDVVCPRRPGGPSAAVHAYHHLYPPRRERGQSSCRGLDLRGPGRRSRLAQRPSSAQQRQCLDRQSPLVACAAAEAGATSFVAGLSAVPGCTRPGVDAPRIGGRLAFLKAGGSGEGKSGTREHRAGHDSQRMTSCVLKHAVRRLVQREG